MFTTAQLVLIAVTFLLAGGVKGVIGMGMPTVSLALLTATVGLHPAMGLLLVPTVVTNIWQAFAGGHLRKILRRQWLFLGGSAIAVWPGVHVLASVDPRWMSLLLGVLIVLYSVAGLGLLRARMPRLPERPTGAVAGLLNGLITGMTGSSVFPGVAFLQSLKLPRDELVQSMGILFTVCTMALAVSMGGQGMLNNQLLLASAGALLPAMLGMWLGQHLRQRMSETVFRRVFFAGLLLMGVYLTARGLAG